MAKKPKTRGPRKKRRSIKELDAIEELYGSRLTTAKMARSMFIYSIAAAAFAYLLYASWIITIIYVVLICLYVLHTIIPNNVEINYQRQAMAQRNRAINIIAQSLSSGNSSVGKGLHLAINSANGEFKNDLRQLYAKILSDSDIEATHKAFKDIREKYQEDVYFSLFMEQLEIALGKASPDIRTLIVFRDSHNAQYTAQKKFQHDKTVELRNLGVITCIAFAMCVTLAVSNGYSHWVKIYAHSFAGRVDATIFMFVVFMIVRSFMKKYQDESITSI